MNKRRVTLVLLSCIILPILAQVKYSTSWFGPAANPVPEISGDYIPENTEVNLSSAYYFNKGDQTFAAKLKVEFPLISQQVSIKIWSEFLEYFNVSNEIRRLRNMVDSSGSSTGDIYFQTRIRLMTENVKKPGIILNATLKTASGTNFLNRRFFDTPGYYFDVEISKSFNFDNFLVDKILVSGNAGFMCWETSGSRQDDAIIYGIQTKFQRKNFHLTLFAGGYDGWMYRHPAYGSDYGDSPLVCSTTLSYLLSNKTLYLKYLKGLKDYPYDMFRIGIILPVEKLNPVFK